MTPTSRLSGVRITHLLHRVCRESDCNDSVGTSGTFRETRKGLGVSPAWGACGGGFTECLGARTAATPGERDLTGLSDRGKVQNAHLLGKAGPRSLDAHALAPKHLLSDLFRLICKSVKPHRNPAPFLDCTSEAEFPGSRNLWCESLWTSFCPRTGSRANQLWRRATRVIKRLELAQSGQEVIIIWGISESFADYKDIYWSYETQGNSEYS